MASILAVLSVVEAVLGTKAAQQLIGFLTGPDSGLTDEQKVNLAANYQDYADRIAKLRVEVGGE